MDISQFIKKINGSVQFKEFIKEDPTAYLCSFFFVRDFLEKKDQTQVDFYSPKKENIFSLKIEENGNIENAENKTAETISHKRLVPEKIQKKIKLKIDDLKPLLEKEMKKEGINNDLQKILVYLVSVNGNILWNCTGFLKGLAILQAIIEDKTGKVASIQKKSFFDMLKFIGKPGDKKK